MRKVLVFYMALLIAGCGGGNVNRDLCVGGAAIGYQAVINKCKEESLSYDQCVKKYDNENEFQGKQEGCR